MTKADLVDAVADRSGLSRADASRAIEAVFDSRSGVISRALAAGDSVAIPGFGIFDARRRSARAGRNPRTGDTIQIAARTAPAFRAGQGLKDALNLDSV